MKTTNNSGNGTVERDAIQSDKPWAHERSERFGEGIKTALPED
jgi:hypothetical protein